MYRAIAAACLAGALVAAIHHPIVPGLVVATLLLWAGIVWRWPSAWLFVVPALLPVLDFLPWTGWVAVDEFDLLLLATAAGGYLHLAKTRPDLRSSALPLGLLALLVTSGVVALLRGIGDAGGFEFDWFGGYRDAMNALRIFKSLLFAALFAPLLAEVFGRDGQRAGRLLACGMVAGVALVAAAVLRERADYPGLLEFSTPYRSSAAFWEMHIGGAALDGYLALAVPFAAWALLEARRRLLWLGAALLVLLTGYACLTTFSRGMYLAVLLGLALLAWLRLRPAADPDKTGVLTIPVRIGLAVAFLALAEAAFLAAGYRGALWLLGATAVALAANGRLRRPWWPLRLRTQGGMLVTMALMVEAVAVVNGGSFLAERLAASDQDFGGRLAHWRHGLALLHDGSDWLLGKGLGRMPARYVEEDRRQEFPADLHFVREDGNGYALLSGPPTDVALAGLFGLEQRVPIVRARRYTAELDVRAFAATAIGVSFCRKHLIYDAVCVDARTTVAAANGWQHLKVELTGKPLPAGAWYASHEGVFTVAVLGAGKTVAVDNLHLTTDDRQLLKNGDFSQGMARWFLGGGAYFVPWHIDSLWLEVLLDQGLFGLAALMLFAFASWRRLVFGEARRHVLAPFVAASLAGYLAVGLFSSLMDVPRVAVLFFLLALASWHLRGDADGRANSIE